MYSALHTCTNVQNVVGVYMYMYAYTTYKYTEYKCAGVGAQSAKLCKHLASTNENPDAGT